MSCCVTKKYYSPQKKRILLLHTAEIRRKMQVRQPYCNMTVSRGILLFAPKLRAGTKPWFITLSISKILKNKILPVHSEFSTGFNCKPNT